MSESVSLTRHVTRGIAWSMLGFVLTRLIGFGSLLVLTRLLLPRQFGVVAAVTIVLGFIEMCADLGMASTVIYEQRRGIDERVETAFTLNLLLTVALALAALLLAPVIAAFFRQSAHTALFRLVALDVLLTGMGTVHDGLLMRDLRFNARLVTQVLAALARAAVGIPLAVFGFGAASMVWGYVAGTAVWMLSLWLITDFWPRLSIERSAVRSMLSYGAGASLLGLVAQLSVQADGTIVGRVLGARALGLYAVAFRIPTLVLENIAVQVSLVAFPALARQRVTAAEGVGASTGRLIRYQTLYALPLAAGLAVLAEPVVVTAFSARWRAAAGVFAAVCVMSGLSSSGFALGDAFKALGRQRVMVVLNIVQLPVLVAVILLAAPYGVTAVAWARALMVGVWTLMMMTASRRILGLPLRHTVGEMLPGLTAAAGVAAGAGAVRVGLSLPAVPEILVAGVVGAGGGLLALALLSPRAFAELRAAARPLLRGLRRRPVAEQVAGAPV